MTTSTAATPGCAPGVSGIEVIHPAIVRGAIKHALFDFDGTISLIREGWQQIMIPQMVGWLMETPRHESEDEIRRVVVDFVTRLTGKQTMYQMIQLAEEIERRGGQPEDPLVYKRRYLDALWQRIQHRVAALKANPDTVRLTVPALQRGLASVRLTVPAGHVFRYPRVAIAADVVVDGRRLGQIAEATVELVES